MDTITTTTTATTTLPLPRTHPHTHNYSQSRTPRKPLTPTSSRSTRWRTDLPAQSPLPYHPPQSVASPRDKEHSSFTHERVLPSSNIRSRSPDAQSKVSSTSSAAVGAPHLRKKPKSISIHSKPRSKSSGTAETPTNIADAYYEQGDDTLVASSPPIPADATRLLTRVDSNLSQQQGAFYKRPPASHSSYGVETTCGPPPSYTTQRTFSQERIKKPDRNTILWAPSQDQSPSAEYSPPRDHLPREHQGTQGDISPDSSSPTATRLQHNLPLVDTHSTADMPFREHNQYAGEITEEDGKRSSSEGRKSEDLFLNIARVDAARAPQTKSDRRRSRLSIPFFSSHRSSNETKSSPVKPQYEADQRTPQVEEPRYYSKRSSISHHFTGAMSRNHFADAGQNVREQNLDTTPDAEVSEYQLGRRNSGANTELSKLSQRPSQGLRGQRSVAESSFTNASRIGEHIATESTVSTTAPSTVWDELDDLKSRIRKLELTGKLPPSSAAAMSSAERPRTATTVATTMSASPKMKIGGVSLPSAVDGIPSTIHPLLHEALGGAKQTLNHEIYSKLYATASDALQLTIMMNGETQSTSHAINANHERQIKRRTENLCRGITELAIALTAESKSVSTTNRPTSREQANPPSAMLRSRRYSNDAAERAMSSRATSRLDGRRSSLVLGASSPMVGNSDPSLPPLPGLRLGRSSTLTRSRRGPGAFDGTDDEVEASPSVRPVSRAMTESVAHRRASRDPVKASREFTSQHPMPQYDASNATTPLPNYVNTTFTSRRKYTSPSTTYGVTYENSPTTPQEVLSPREGWAHLNIAPGAGTSSDIMSDVGRSSSGRRSLGLAGRLGSSMGSRLRGGRNDRAGRETVDETGTPNDIVPSQRHDMSMYHA